MLWGHILFLFPLFSQGLRTSLINSSFTHFLLKLYSIQVCAMRQSINQPITFNENIFVTARRPEPSFPSGQRWVPWQFRDDLFCKHTGQGGIRMGLMLPG